MFFFLFQKKDFSSDIYHRHLLLFLVISYCWKKIYDMVSYQILLKRIFGQVFGYLGIGKQALCTWRAVTWLSQTKIMGYKSRNTRDSNKSIYHFSNTRPYNFPDISLTGPQDLSLMCQSPYFIASRVLLSLVLF